MYIQIDDHYYTASPTMELRFRQVSTEEKSVLQQKFILERVAGADDWSERLIKEKLTKWIDVPIITEFNGEE